ncbi:hypothetical protein FB45DRAFT_44329 [Roridomyces roridus]|uniref:Uncharacterized protein n=1 Tax=Roridomyces roridus TaxID=1738132 RepID=A0AAD7BRK6_9AGAR|nr:hypothetical protein FB45DRAFT_44329 [Roridomyces roridus]
MPTHTSGPCQDSEDEEEVEEEDVGDDPLAPQRVLSGSVCRSSCRISELLREYLPLAEPEMVEDHAADLDALHSRHLHLALAPQVSGGAAASMSLPVLVPNPAISSLSMDDGSARPRSQKRKGEELMLLPPAKKRGRDDHDWFGPSRGLLVNDRGWSDRSEQATSLTSSHASVLKPTPAVVPSNRTAASQTVFPFSYPQNAPSMLDAPFTFLATSTSSLEAMKPCRRRRPPKGKGCKTTRGARSKSNKRAKAFRRGQVLQASDFSILTDATVSSSGWQGGLPPMEASKDLKKIWKNPELLKAAVSRLFPVPYIKHPDDLNKEQSTFFVDRDGAVFMFRSYRATWLMKLKAEVEEACKVLLGEDLGSKRLEASFKGKPRGNHFALIIGWHRQCVRYPTLSEWHVKHQDRVDAFLALPIVQRIINWVSKMVELAFPGVAHRFREDAKKHEHRYKIKPHFGLFWNFCINAWFLGQDRVHCGPHADWRNQIGVCGVLVYVTARGAQFQDEVRTWLVLWEAGVAIQMPPWVLALYPSSLLYHFNVDVNNIEFVTTAGDVLWPTKENSVPLVENGECGRGSMVFFNQGTMRHYPEMGYDALNLTPIELKTTDYGRSAQIAFEQHVSFQPFV